MKINRGMLIDSNSECDGKAGECVAVTLCALKGITWDYRLAADLGPSCSTHRLVRAQPDHTHRMAPARGGKDAARESAPPMYHDGLDFERAGAAP